MLRSTSRAKWLIVSSFVLLGTASYAQTTEAPAAPKSAQNTKEPKLDRSGEPMLVKILESHGKLQGIEASIWYGSRVSPDKPFLYSKTGKLQYQSGSTFRYEEAAYFGDASLIIADGKTYLYDPMTWGTAVELRPVGKTIVDSGLVPRAAGAGGAGNFRRVGGAGSLEIGRGGSIFLALLGGPSQLTALVPATVAVASVDYEKGYKGVRFRRAGLGIVTLVYAEKDPEMLVRRIEIDQERPGGEENPFGDNNLVRQNIYITRRNVQFDPKLFSTKVAPGLEVRDRRKEKPGEGGYESEVKSIRERETEEEAGGKG